MAGEIEGDDAEVGFELDQVAGQRRQVAGAAEQAVQQYERVPTGARSYVSQDQEASRMPERISHSSWARSEAPRIRDRLPQYRQWMNAGSISTNRLPHL